MLPQRVIRQIEKLSHIAKQRAAEIGNRVYSRYANRHILPKEEDYPAVVSACAELTHNEAYWDKSHGFKEPSFQQPLLNTMRELGTIGQTPNPQNVPMMVKRTENLCKIGYCAEQHAANKLLKKRHGTPLNDIFFGYAYRPRTGEIVNPCYNCRTIFKNVLK